MAQGGFASASEAGYIGAMTEIQSSNPLIMVAAGGTGGHLFPAEALSAALSKRGIATALATDNRAAKYADYFSSMHVVPSATFRGRDPISIARTGVTLVMGLAKAAMMMRSVKPSAVVGFGGYPSVPPVFAASLLKIPTVLHEQNAVMGRANRFLASRVTAIATGFAGVTDKDKALAIKTTCIGNPLRPAVIEAAKIPYPPLEPNGPLKLLVFGGSQGASIMAEVVPPAIAKLEPHLQMRLKITQQTREEDIARVRDIYARAQVSAEIAPFFNDLPARIAAAHLVVSRSGAGTVAELSAIGRPGILVPLPHALDQDQAANALVLEKAGGAIRLLQKDFTPDRLAVEIDALAADSGRLTAMAERARSIGVLDAAERLADLVLKTARVPS
jgi:UDP-N-acetylglucosamine--N-acetylmuramyl-(pentapeptide) pyrophosphoryl-undecaprenol N-acetylglucosamine transferase